MFVQSEREGYCFFQAVHRILKAAELNRVCTGDLIVKHSTLAIDATSCFHQIKEFWRQLAWPDLVGSYNFVLKIIDVRKK
jgi:BAI1-associated protein 3